MNLITKLKRFMHLRAKGVSMKVALREFKSPITEGEFITLIAVIIIAIICWTMVYKTEIDGELTIAIEREAIASQQLASIYSEKQHIERVLVSALNGAIIENGRKVTMCRLSASGECK